MPSDSPERSKLSTNQAKVMKSQIAFVKARPKDLNGSGGKGTMYIDYEALVKAFGKPHDCTKEGPWRSGDGKVRAEWAFKTFVEGKLLTLTIYDYRQPNTPVEQVKQWSIGLKGDIQIAASFLASRLGQHCFRTHKIVLVEKRLSQGSTILMSAERIND